jgi:hypothetical protein
MLVFLLIVHGLLAFALLGAVTHQAISVSIPTRAGEDTFTRSLRAVRPAGYTKAIVILFVLTFVLGSVIYPSYRLQAHPQLQATGHNLVVAIFDLKEHFVALGVGMLPAYWYYWRSVPIDVATGTRRALTVILAAIVWWSFLVGHIVNNMKGLKG